MHEDPLRREIHDALDAITRPAPGLLTAAMGRVRARRRPRWQTWALEAGGVMLAALIVGGLAVALNQARREKAVEPVQSPPTAVTPARLEPGAQVAWLTSGVGIDPAGNILGTIGASDGIRSPDGTRLYAIAGKTIVAYSALTGKQEGAAIELSSQLVSRQLRLSPDGRYLGVLELGPAYAVEVIDLQTRRSSARLDLGPAPSNGPGLLLVAPDARELYVFTNLWRRPAEFVVLGFDGSSLRLVSRVTDGRDGHTVPRFDGLFPAVWTPGGLPIRLQPDGRTIVGYSPVDGRVSWFDLKQLTVTQEVQVDLPNPFWLAPVFSPDGGMLYLHEGFSGRGGVQAVDLMKRELVKGTKLVGIFGRTRRWLAQRFVIPVFAGGTTRTAALAPDGRLYLIAAGGVHVFQVPDLTKKAVWLPAPSVWRAGDGPGAAIWVSGDGKTVFVLGRDERIYVLRTADGALIASTPADRPVSGDFLVFGP